MSLTIPQFVFCSLLTAILLITFLVWLLHRLEARTKNAVQAGQLPQASGAAAHLPRRFSRLPFSAFAMWLTVSTVLLLFTANIDQFNRVVITEASVVWVSIAAALLSATASFLLFRHLGHHGPAPVSVTVIKEAVAITGTIFALFAGKIAAHSLTKSTNSNMAAVYGQIYQNDMRISEREFSMPPLQNLYNHPLVQRPTDPPTAKGIAVVTADFEHPDRMAGEYWQARLQSYFELTINDRFREQLPAVLKETNGPVELLDLIQYARGPQTAEYSASANKASAHITTILNNLHLIYDYASRDVVPASDTDTWTGYFEDFGPHPIMLAAVWAWLDRDYMTRGFYREAERRLSGKRDLYDTLDELGEDPEARALRAALEANSPAAAPGRDTQIKPLAPDVYVRLARLVDAHVREHSREWRDAQYLAICELAVFNRYIVTQPEYPRHLRALTPDVAPP